ncbi:MAG: hypothetical protein M1829_005563 [Trizodia sp. TS-e1964]|nr:MAG: hypothetical protein M1829_005563 [Trizodia sp. TS-e1964]
MDDTDAALLCPETDSSGDENAIKSASPSPAHPTTTRKTNRSSRRELEEGENSASQSPSSLQSAPMSESSSHSLMEVEEDYPIENKYKSEADREAILALPEVERETILAERASVLERAVQRNQLKLILLERSRVTGDPDAKKRKLAVTELDDNQRKSTRQKTTLGGRKVGENSAPLEEYKRQREQREIDNEQRKKDNDVRAKDKKPIHDGGSDADAEGESDPELAVQEKATVPSPKKDAPNVATLQELNRIRFGRSRFVSICYTPGFEQGVVGCYVRASAGPDPRTGNMLYRVAQISEIVTGKPYAMEGKNKQIKVDLYAVLYIGKIQKKTLPFIHTSDSPFTEPELDRYRKLLESEELSLPSRSFVNQKIADINKLVNHSWTDAEITAKLKRSGIYNDRFASFEKMDIINRRNEAIELGDEAAVAKCDAELSALAGPKLAFGTSMVSPKKVKPYVETEQDRLALLNKRNRKANTEDVRKAQLAERYAEGVARHNAMQKRNELRLSQSTSPSKKVSPNTTPTKSQEDKPEVPQLTQTQTAFAATLKALQDAKTKAGKGRLTQYEEEDAFAKSVDIDVDFIC